MSADQTSENMKACPMCGEQILAVAIKCRYCGEYLSQAPLGHFLLGVDPEALREEHERLTAERKRYSLLSVLLGGGGIAVFFAFAMLNEVNRHLPDEMAMVMVIGGGGLFITGVVFAMKYKGRHPLTGFLICLGCLGAIILLLIKDEKGARLKEIEQILSARGITL